MCYVYIVIVFNFRLKLYNANDPYISNPVWSKSYTDLGFKENIVIPKLTEEVLFYLQRKSLVLELWGSQCKYTKEYNIEIIVTLYKL